MKPHAATLFGLWLITVVAGFGYLFRYQANPGRGAEAPARWPTTSKLVLEPDGLTLVLFVHPRCPCTRASLLEFHRVLTDGHERISGRVVISVPETADRQWPETDLLDYATEQLKVPVLIDIDLIETRRFGIHTSGDALLYDYRGQLLFSGGLTPSRGHQGDSRGRALVLGVEQESMQQQDTLGTSAVYGCPLENPSDFCGLKGSTRTKVEPWPSRDSTVSVP